MKLKHLPSLMDIAEAVAKNSPDKETQVGALLVHGDTGAILSLNP